MRNLLLATAFLAGCLSADMLLRPDAPTVTPSITVEAATPATTMVAVD